MPPIQAVQIDPDRLTLEIGGQTFVLTSKDLPADLATAQDVEDWINTVWVLKRLPPEFVLQVHVFSLKPLLLTVGTWNHDEDSAPPDAKAVLTLAKDQADGKRLNEQIDPKAMPKPDAATAWWADDAGSR